MIKPMLFKKVLRHVIDLSNKDYLSIRPSSKKVLFDIDPCLNTLTVVANNGHQMIAVEFSITSPATSNERVKFVAGTDELSDIFNFDDVNDISFVNYDNQLIVTNNIRMVTLGPDIDYPDYEKLFTDFEPADNFFNIDYCLNALKIIKHIIGSDRINITTTGDKSHIIFSLSPVDPGISSIKICVAPMKG